MNHNQPVVVKQYLSGHEELEVYKRAFTLSLEIHKASSTFPKEEKYSLTDQLRRATKSICANIAEGYAKQSFSVPEFRRFLGLAIGSCAESRVWISYVAALEYIDQATGLQWKKEYVILERMIGKLRFNLGGLRKSKTLNLQNSKPL